MRSLARMLGALAKFARRNRADYDRLDASLHVGALRTSDIDRIRGEHRRR